MFWIASFENREAYHIDHLNRETNQVFSKALFGLMKGGPIAALAGSYRGALHHLEKPGAAHVSEGCHAVVCGASAKDAASAAELVALLKTDARALLAAEAGALRCTIVPPGAIGMVEGDMPPGHPSFADATTLVWARAWRTAADYAAHLASGRAEAAAPAIAALVDEQSLWTLACAPTTPARHARGRRKMSIDLDRRARRAVRSQATAPTRAAAAAPSPRSPPCAPTRRSRAPGRARRRRARRARARRAALNACLEVLARARARRRRCTPTARAAAARGPAGRRQGEHRRTGGRRRAARRVTDARALAAGGRRNELARTRAGSGSRMRARSASPTRNLPRWRSADVSTTHLEPSCTARASTRGTRRTTAARRRQARRWRSPPGVVS